MTALVLIHGWGFDGAVWDEVAARLGERPRFVADLGFFRRPALPAVERPLVVGHSMGFAWALAHLPRPWAGAVAVNAFPRFVAADGFPGVPSRSLALMRRQFASDPASVTGDFLRRCGATPGELGQIDAGALGAALDWLADCDQRDALAGLDCPLAVLAGERDPIVPKPMSQAGFGDFALEMIAEGGHLLPLSHPDRVVAAITRIGP